MIACSACGGAQKPNPYGRLPPELIQREVRSHYGVFRKCYEDGLGRDAKLQGKVVVRFIIDRQGSVSEVAKAGSTDMPDAKVVECIMAEYRKLRFPEPEGGIVTVVYPIMFSPGDDDAPRDPASPLP